MCLRGNLVGRLFFFGLLCLVWLSASAQPDYGSRLGLRQGTEYSYIPQGPGVMLNAVDPAVRK